MKVVSKKSVLSGHVAVPGSKSHTIRSLILAALADGVSHISNPLEGKDSYSTAEALKKIGADITVKGKVWTVQGAGANIHLPDSPIDVGNSGSLMYFLAPILATLDGDCTFTGDESICRRPVDHLLDALEQLGARTKYEKNTGYPPFSFSGPIDIDKKLVTDGVLSQYISGFMMAATRMNGTCNIELTNPKETPYLKMTKMWLDIAGSKVKISKDYKKIEVEGPSNIEGFDINIPSDWESVAFPLIAALISDSEIIIDNIDCTGSQGDDKIVDILKSVGANIEIDKKQHELKVRGNKRLSTKGLPRKTLKINISDFPDAICALAVIACFIEGKTIITDLDMCRRKETDRVKAMAKILFELGADIRDEVDSLIIVGHCPYNPDGTQNTMCRLHGGKVDPYNDHRIAMAMACFGLGLRNGESIEIKNGECCNVSFPNFYDVMNKLGAGFGLSE